MHISRDWFQHRCPWVRPILGAALLCVTASTSADYIITDLGANIRPYDISNNGIIAGRNESASPFVGFVGVVGALAPLSSSSLESQANAVNSSGLSVGYNFIDGVQRRAFLRAPGAALSNFDSNAVEASDVSEFDHIAGTTLFNGQRLGFVYNLQNQSLLSLPTFGGAEGWANGINNLGFVVGAAQDASGAFIGFRALYGSNNITNLGKLTGFTDSEANAVNDVGHVVGWASRQPASASSKRAFVWVPVTGATGIQDLGAIGADVGSVANDINNAGHVVGYSVAANDSTRAFFHDRKATDVMALAGNLTHLYLGTSNGVYRSGDGGVTIASRNNGLTELRITALATTTSNPLIVYAGTATGVFKTVDGGANWTAVNTGLTYTDNTVSPAVERVRAIRTLAVVGSGTTEVLAGTNVGVHRTTNGGGSWSLDNSPSSSPVAIDEIRGIAGSLFVHAITNNNIFFSNNGGATWGSILGSGVPTEAAITAIEATPTAVYVGTSAGVFKTINTTDPFAWTDANGIDPTGLPAARNIRRLRFHVATGTLYAALAGVGIYKTTGNGTWTALPTTGLTNLDAAAFAVTSATPPTLYVGTLSGMFRFTDTVSTSWTPTNNMQDLNALIPTGTGWALRNATAINNAGQIVGWGDLNGASHGFLLTPTAGIPTARLTLVKSLPAPPYKQFVPVNYSITVTNNGPDTATSILLTDWLPKDVVLQAVQGAPCTNTDGITLTCQLDSLEAGKSRKITITVTPNGLDVSLNNTARVIANESDPVFSDNTSAVQAKTDKCFIATAAYGSFLDPHVQTLRHFRDEYLLTNAAGRAFVAWYYRTSPPLAAFIAQHDSARVMTRLLLTPVVYAVKYPVMALVMMVLVIVMVGVSRWRRSRAVVIQGA